MDKLSIIIFGVTSNLAEIKLIPALFDLFVSKKISNKVSFLGLARNIRERESMELYIEKAVKTKARLYEKKHLKSFLEAFSFEYGDFSEAPLYKKMENDLCPVDECENRVIFLATHPEYYEKIFKNLNKHSLTKKNCGWVRLMIEKPLGSDLASAKRLNKILSRYFDEDQIFRLDHYLAKETIQNILAFRFANVVFEPLMNKEYVDHIQITVAEEVGVEGRENYYDNTGALKDVGQNHLLQMLIFAVMKLPDYAGVKDMLVEKHRVLSNLVVDKESLVLGQYENYSREGSSVDTFFAFKTSLKSGDFKGVPIYVRSGKALEKKVSEINIVFKTREDMPNNVLTYRLQPSESIVFNIGVKKDGLGMDLTNGIMEYCYEKRSLLNPYERMVWDVIEGNKSFFNEAREVEMQWDFIDKLKEGARNPIIYKRGSWGPKEAEDLMFKDGREWLEVEESYCKR